MAERLKLSNDEMRQLVESSKSLHWRAFDEISSLREENARLEKLIVDLDELCKECIEHMHCDDSWVEFGFIKRLDVKMGRLITGPAGGEAHGK